MTNKQPDALRLADEAWNFDCSEYRGVRSANAAMMGKLQDCADMIRKLHAENTTLQQGYAAARLEIESLQARIKTMAEEHADELMVAHLDGRMRAAQPAGVQQPGAHGAIMSAAYDFRDAHLTGSIEQKHRAHTALVSAVYNALRASHGQAPAQAAPLKTEHWNPLEGGNAETALQMACVIAHRDAQAVPAAVAVPTFEDFCKRHGLDPKKMDGHGGMWARVALDECRATAQPAPQQEAVAWLNPWRADQVTTDYDAYGEHGIPLVYQQPAPATQQASQQEPVAWYVTGCGRLLDEDEAKAEARHIGGSARAIPLYTAPQADSVTAPAAGAVAHTLSDAQIEAMPVWRNFVGLWPESRREIVDAVVDLLAAAPTPPAQAADSVLEDAALLDWLLLHISGAEFRRIGVHYSGNASRADVDAARKQGANHD